MRAWLSTNRRFAGEPRFPGLAMFGVVESEVERDGKVSRARRYYFASTQLSAAEFARAVRAHWASNRLHWVLDDLMLLRTASGPANMATIRHAVLNIIKDIPDKDSLKVRRKTLGWDDDYLCKPSLTGGRSLQASPMGTARARRQKWGRLVRLEARLMSISHRHYLLPEDGSLKRSP